MRQGESRGVFLGLPARPPSLAALLVMALPLLAMPWPALAAPPAQGQDRCAVPAELLAGDETFPALAERLRHGQAVEIVAVGGASTRGTGPLEQSYPARLQVELARRWPKSRITVINQGVPRETAAEMLRRLSADVVPRAPQLVIWETGTNDAVAGVSLDDFAQALKDGLALLRAGGIDVMMMDMQYSKESAAVINFERYADTMQGIAQVGGARLFKRYDMMKYWSESGVFEFDGPMEGRQTLAGQVYDCIARRLADAIDLAMP